MVSTFYASGRGDNSGFTRVSHNRLCPICGKSDWCLLSSDGSAAICARIESKKPVGHNGAGWLHVLDDRRDHHRVIRPVVIKPAPITNIDFSAISAGCEKAISAEGLACFADSLGLSVESLRRLNVGWHREKRCWSFPMRDDSGAVVGIRLRRPGGFKFAVSGSKSALFVPQRIDGSKTIYIAEGPTDTAALLDFGIDAIGRPSCMGGVSLITKLIGRLRPQRVVVVADSDAPGQKGAKLLADVLASKAIDLRIITPPSGIKDVREWKQQGAAAADLAAAPTVTFPHFSIRRAQRHAVEHRRKHK